MFQTNAVLHGLSKATEVRNDVNVCFAPNSVEKVAWNYGDGITVTVHLILQLRTVMRSV